MKTKKLIALIVALTMIASVMPVIGASAADNVITVTATKSMTANICKASVADDDVKYSDSYDISSLYIYHSNWNQRSGYVGFDISNAFTDEQLTDAYTVKNASLTVNCAAVATVKQPAVSLAAIDNTKWSEGVYTEPSELNLPEYNQSTVLTTIPEGCVIVDEQDITSTGEVTFDVTDYLAENYVALKDKGVSFALISITRSIYSTDNIEVLKLLIEGKNGSVKPTLTIEMAKKASVSLELKDPTGKTLKTKDIPNLAEGNSYIPSDEDAPVTMEVNGVLYVRDEVSPLTLEAGVNSVTVTYSATEIQSVAAPENVPSNIAGNEPILPKTLTATAGNGAEIEVPVVWSTDADVNSITEKTTVTYTASVEGYSGKIEAEVLTYPCDHSVETYWYSGDDANSANFAYYNSLGYSYGNGTMIADCDFVANEGENKLIMYGGANTSSYSSTAAPIRFMQNQQNGKYVFEYYDGAWVLSSVPSEVGVNYRLRTEINVTDQTYRAYISADGGEFKEITKGSAKFRGSVSAIDRMLYTGSMEVTSHKTVWVDGYTLLTIRSISSEGVELQDPYTIKYGTGILYTYDSALSTIEKDGNFYIREDIDTYPSKTVTGTNDTLTVVYNSVEMVSSEAPEISVVQGDAVNMPSQIKVTFSDGQSLDFDVTWEDVDTSVPGDYPVKGTIAGFERTAEATVHVKEIVNVPYTSQNTVATNSGGWNWYVEPSGTHIEPGDTLATRYQSGAYSTGGYVFQHDRTYMGWVEDEGTIVVAQYDHDTDEYKRVVVHKQLESDDHNNPAVVILPDGRIMAVYSMHTNEPYMYFRVSKYPEDISEWNDEWFYYCETDTETESSNGYNATYPTVFMVHDDEGITGNDVIYVGWRGVHWKPTFAKFSMPDENGQLSVVMGQTQFANTTYGYSTYDGSDAPNAKTDGGKTDSGRRPYTKYDYDYERNKIYITFTANHPDNDKRNHIYYIYLNIEDQGLYTVKDNFLQPLPKENKQQYASLGAEGTSGQWGIVTVDLVDKYPELLVFDATEQTGQSFNPKSGNVERRGWTWDIKVNEAGEPCIVYADITATPPTENGGLPSQYLEPSDDNSRSHHYYWYARWDSESQEWVKTFLTYAGKWFHENATQERCYSGGLTFDHNAPDANVIYLSIPTMGEYGNVFEIYRWESDDHGATWTIREPLTQNSKTSNARPNAIYNYKQNADGTNAGPRLLWISGEYRYWMNYEYKTGVMTDFAAPGFSAQDDPEMFADAELYVDGEKADALPVSGDEVTLTAKFNVTNISIGDGSAKFALAHYSADNILKGVQTADETIPARSVPQIGMIGAPKTADGGLSTLGDPEAIVEIEYTSAIEEGDRIALFAWDTGVEYPLSSIISLPYEISTDGSSSLMRETFTYEGTEKLVLDENEDTFNGWVAKGYNSSGSVAFDDSSYVAVTKAPFGNTALHIYRTGGEGLMVSHALPDTDGEDYTIEFTMRCIDEMSWNNTDNEGFTLSHGIPTSKGDSENSASAFQFRHKSAWRDENGRGTSGNVRNTIAFDGGSETEIFHNVDLYRDMSGNEELSYSKGTGYYDSENGVYIHDFNDALMTGSLYRVTISVHPALKTVEMSIYDGYRMATYTSAYNSSTSYDWEANPVDTITFSIGSDKWGELYIDNFRVYKTNGSGETIRKASVTTSDGADLLGSAEWTIVPMSGVYVFLNSEGESIDVTGQGTTAGTKVSTYAYNGGDNQKFYIVETEGGYLIRGKQSGKYLSVASDGSVTLQNAAKATVFTIEDIE